jgi:hypothetical protein
VTLQDDTAEINRLLTDRLESVLDRYWPGWTHGRSKRSAFPEPKSGTDLGSFEVFLSPCGKDRRGQWHRRSQGIGGNPLNLIAYAITGDHKAYREAFAEAREFLGLERKRQETPEERERREANYASRKRETEAAELRRAEEQAREDEDSRAAAYSIWRRRQPIVGTVGEVYLKSRGYDGDLSVYHRSIGYMPSLRYPKQHGGGEWPAIICAVIGPDGRFRALHRTYLDGKGAKAPVNPNKVVMARPDGGAIWLGEPAARIHTCEGLETGLSIRAMTGRREPVAVCMSTSGLMNFEPPPVVRSVLNWPDGDLDKLTIRGGLEQFVESPGYRASRMHVERMKELGIRAAMVPLPKDGSDWNDIWQATRSIAGAA